MQTRTLVRFVVLGGIGICALLAGAVVATRQARDGDRGTPPAALPTAEDSQAIAALSLPDDERQAQLAQLAEAGNEGDRARARYLLALDALNAGNVSEAIAYLDDLDRQLPQLAGYVRLHRATAEALAGNADNAEALRQQILNDFPNDPVAAEALYELGQRDSQYWDRLLTEFPRHPRSGEIALQRLEADPNDPDLLKLLSTHLYLPNIVELLDRLVNEHGDSLTPEDWETVAFGYWEKTTYGSAGKAYANAPNTPRNLYRSARGLQLGGEKVKARQAYRVLAQAYPNAEETPGGLLHLSRIVPEPEAALPLLDTVIETFPDDAPEALLERSKVLRQLGSSQSAQQARQSILTQYGESDIAARVRWENAQTAANAGDARQAWDWAQQIVRENPESEYAPEAAFWIGKWAQRLNRPDDARQAFEEVLRVYPESYYAWRSASLLGWDVGTFTTVRSLTPTVANLSQRPVLPAGSDTTRELYALGFDKAAWTRWQVEFPDPMNPTVPEQYADGILRQAVGDYIDSIFMLTSLSWRDDPEELAQYREFKADPAFWYTLYPFPYREAILEWSKQRELDPLLTVGLIRQESRFMPKIRSVADAVGLMQVIYETGEWIAEKNDEPPPQDLTNPEDNIRLGTLYLDYVHDEYNNNTLFALASYNAGPGNVDDWRQRFGFDDPDRFVQQIPFPETNGYISSVMGNYWNYLRLYNPDIQRQMAALEE